MLVYKNGIDAGTMQFKSVTTEIDITFKSAVETMANLPSGVDGDACYAIDNNHLYVSLNGEWLDQGVFDVQDLLEERLMQGLS